MIDFNSPIIQIPRPTDALQLRKAMVANAISIINVSASDPHTKSIFIDILGPIKGQWDINRPFKCSLINNKYVTQGISTCGLVCRGLWRRMGVEMPALYQSYVFGTAISAEKAFAQKNKCWQSPVPDSTLKPSPGDYLIIGSGTATHVLTVIELKDDQLISVDGGQLDKQGLQMVAKRTRPWTIKNNIPYLGDRSVVGWIIFDMLPFKDQINVPTGWDQLTL